MVVKSDQHEEDIRLLLARLPGDFPRAGVIHVGAHLGEEVDAYFQAGFQQVLLIEANPDCCLELDGRFRSDPRVRIFNCAISDRNGKATLHIHTSRSGSVEPASLLEMKEFQRIVKTLSTPRSIPVDSYTLDHFLAVHSIDSQRFSLLNLDIQGAELQALRGATNTLLNLRGVITEVNLVELYAGSASEQEVFGFMTTQSFEKDYVMYHSLYDEASTFPAWGECLFLKTSEPSAASPGL